MDRKEKAGVEEGRKTWIGKRKLELRKAEKHG